MLFDQLWKQGVMPRPDCYAWLAKEMGIPERSCHFRNFKKKELRLAREKIDDVSLPHFRIEVDS